MLGLVANRSPRRMLCTLRCLSTTIRSRRRLLPSKHIFRSRRFSDRDVLGRSGFLKNAIDWVSVRARSALLALLHPSCNPPDSPYMIVQLTVLACVLCHLSACLLRRSTASPSPSPRLAAMWPACAPTVPCATYANHPFVPTSRLALHCNRSDASLMFVTRARTHRRPSS